MSRRGSRVPWLLVCALSATAAGAGLPVLFSSEEASADSGEPVAAPAPQPAPSVPDSPPTHSDELPNPNSQYPHSPGEESYEAAPAGRRAGLDRAAEWSDVKSGAEVANAWSAYGAAKADEATLDRARRAAGIQGTDDLGIE